MAISNKDQWTKSLRRTIAPYLPKSIKRIAKTAVRRATPNQESKDSSRTVVPLISVVVPVYNVEDLVAECLESILEQTYSHLEIIVVDDGSTDRSLARVEEIAERDSRIRVVTQPNAGLGAARNAGTRLASGKYLVFADSDDFVPPAAYKAMLDTLEQSGSDFVTGTYYRFNSSGTRKIEWMKREHATTRLGITIDEYTDGLVNVFAWNKMYRKSVWDRLGMAYTEGLRYEDQEPTTRLMLLSSGFDVIPTPVYGYRVREDSSSITQTKHLSRDVEDRLQVLQLTAATARQLGSEKQFSDWVAKLIRFDLMPYLREAVEADDSYREAARRLFLFIVNQINEQAIAKSHVKVRSLLVLGAHGKWKELAEAILWSDEAGSYFETYVGSTGKVQLRCPHGSIVESVGEERMLILGTPDLETVGVLLSANFSGPVLEIHGWAIPKNRELATHAEQPRVWAVNAQSGESVELSVSRESSESATIWARSKYRDIADAGFVATIDVTSLVAEADRVAWTFEVGYDEPADERVRLVRRAGGSRAMLLDSGTVAGGRDWQLRFDAASGLTLVGNVGVPVVGLSIRDDRIVITVKTASSAPTVKKARLTRAGETVDLAVLQTEHLTELSCERSALGDIGQHSSWLLRIPAMQRSGGYFALENGQARTWESQLLGLRRDESGKIRLEILPQALQVLSYQADGTAVTARAESTVPTSHGAYTEVFLVSDAGVSRRSPIVWDETGCTFEIPGTDPNGRDLPFAGYSVKAVDAQGREYAVLDSRPAATIHAEGALSMRHRVVLTRTRYGNVYVQLSAQLKEDEVGRRAQYLLQQDFSTSNVAIEAKKVVFNAYLGAAATDSSLALSEYLLENRPEMDIVWSVVSESVAVPRGARRAILGSRQWYAELATAGTIVHNIYFDSWFKLRPGQQYLQTWHGTPLKTINHSYWRGIGRSTAWIERMDSQAHAWTFLLSPSSYFSSVVASESDFQGRVIEEGYPRNDALVDSHASRARRAAVRQSMGIKDDQVAILYAPTWRDSRSTKAWKASPVEFFEPNELSRQLGEKYVLMMRGHGHNARAQASQSYEDGVVDVTHHADINDLYLAADLIVTDYSSVMFDAAVARKPMLFYVPDLEEYNSSPRGVYLHVEEIAPGPLLFSTDQLVAAVVEQEWTMLPNTPQYQEFVERFAPRDDGRATERVVAQVWPQR
ncbi:MAG: bifunctional glycosyltransferase family 2 protein/CDP-glycerol:glycerophosphate glycerophosphotransferase [Arthrobacter sp.]|nr:bifunctional glycosyltransferase family 2 protein/CDP-glycerol:glycerophosphate glycerophosphotransferase [Arthrobacter sp.]